MPLHSFDPQIAARVGLNAAVIYQNIVFWTEKNLANGKHVIDGYVWTFNSVKAWGDLFPYLSADQIRRALDKLEADELIVSGNHNKSPYDRTKWYGVSPQIHLGKTTNVIGQNVKPIPDSKPDDKPDGKQEAEAYASLSDRPGSEIQLAVDIYNAAAKLSGWPSVQKLTAARSRSLKARMAEVGGMDGWEAAIEKASLSDFLCGRTSKPWTGLGFDWLVKEANFTKLMEGNYDNRTDNTRAAKGTTGRGRNSFSDNLAAVLGLDPSQGGGGF